MHPGTGIIEIQGKRKKEVWRQMRRLFLCTNPQKCAKSANFANICNIKQSYKTTRTFQGLCSLTFAIIRGSAVAPPCTEISWGFFFPRSLISFALKLRLFSARLGNTIYAAVYLIIKYFSV